MGSLYRLNPDPLDFHSVFANYDDLTRYAALSGQAYPGQILSLSATNKVYVINDDRTVTLLNGGGGEGDSGSTFTTVKDNSANWSSVYTSYNDASANLIRNVSSCSQGNVCYYYNTGSGSSFTVCNLGVTDSPTFTNLSVSCNLSVCGNTLLGNEAGDTITICGKASYPNATSSANAVTIGDVALYRAASKQLIVSDNILSLGDATVYGNLSARNVVYAGTGNSSDWQNTYTTVKTNSAKWDNGWTTVNTNSADWENNWTITNANSANWSSVYTSYNDASANLIRNVGSDSSQGNVCYYYNTGSGSSFTVCNLGVTDSPTFNNLSVTNNLSVCGNTLLGNEAGDTITIRGKASHPNATSSANAVTIGDVALYQGASKQLIVSDDILSLGDATVYGNLSVAGDFTFINTTVTVTSALSVVNKGTGPALYIDQSGVQPIAVFVDYEGGTIIFDNEGKVGIGTSNPAEKLTVSGNISANGTVTFSSLATGTSNSIVIESNGLLQKRAINPDLWNTTADFVSAVPTTTANYVAKFSNSNGVTNSTITDDGTTTTINSNVIVPSTHSIGIATGSGWEMTSYTASVTSGGKSTVITAPKANTTALRYFVSMYTGGALRTAFEVTAVYNGTDVFGDVYSIVDAQATSLLTDVDAVEGTTTIDLEITASEACTVVIHCLRLKSA